MSYQQLTLDERYQISALRREDVSPAEIARQLGRHRSTIMRELARNRIERLRSLTPGALRDPAAVSRYDSPVSAS